MKTVKLENADTWVLLALLYSSEFGKRKLAIRGIISACDFVEHAIISYDELKGALSRLSAARHIKEVGQLDFLPSKLITRIFDDYKEAYKKLDFQQEMNYLMIAINAKEWRRDFDAKKANRQYEYKGLTKEIYQLSLDKYLHG